MPIASSLLDKPKLVKKLRDFIIMLIKTMEKLELKQEE